MRDTAYGVPSIESNMKENIAVRSVQYGALYSVKRYPYAHVRQHCLETLLALVAVGRRIEWFSQVIT